MPDNHFSLPFMNIQNISLILLSLASPLSAATVYTNNNGTGDSDFNNVANWSNGLPGSGNEGSSTADGTLTGNFNNGGEPFMLNSTIATSSFTFAVGGAGDRLFIGDGTTGSLTINNGGALTAIGTNQDVRIGTNSGTGTLIFENGSSLDMRKAVQVISGTLSLATNVATGQNGIQNQLLVGATGTLSYDIDGANYHTLQGSTLPLSLDAASTLRLNFLSAPTTGTTYILVDDVSEFGAGGTDTFGSVNAIGLGAGQSIQVNYNIASLRLEAQVIPEPSSIFLLSISGIGVLLRRRR